MAASLGTVHHTHAQDLDAAQARTLDEAAVVRLAQQHDPSARTARAQMRLAEAALAQASLYPNPELSWEREHLPGGAGESEDVVGVAIPLALSGERNARTALARADAAAAGAREHQLRSAAVVYGLSLFYEALAAQQQAEALAATVERLQDGARVLSRRHEEGTVSGYDRARLELELELARSELRQARSAASVARERLAATLGVEPLTLRGILPPQDAPSARDGIASATPSMHLQEKAANHARGAVSASDATWWPTLRLSAGLKLASGASTELGYVAGVSMELPLLSAGQGLRAEARARAAMLQADGGLHAWRRDVEGDASQQRRAAALAELAALDAATADLLDGLQRAAESGYREGQHSVMELLDAQRARTRVALRRIELQHEARRADIALRAAQGEFE